jgi:hypothetical protein
MNSKKPKDDSSSELIVVPGVVPVVCGAGSVVHRAGSAVRVAGSVVAGSAVRVAGSVVAGSVVRGGEHGVGHVTLDLNWEDFEE